MQPEFDLTDQEWNRIRHLVPARSEVGAPRQIDEREIVSAIVWKLRSGVPWRKLPERFPKWSTVSTYYRQWRQTPLMSQIAGKLDLDLPPFGRQPRALSA